MICKQCETVLTGRQRDFCSDKCRKRTSRTKQTPEDAPQSTNADTSVVNYLSKADSLERGQANIDGVPTDIAGAVIMARAVSLEPPALSKPATRRYSTRCLPGSREHYIASPDKYATRAYPDLLNWGPWMDLAELERAGLKANRVPIPGDWDYKGVV